MWLLAVVRPLQRLSGYVNWCAWLVVSPTPAPSIGPTYGPSGQSLLTTTHYNAKDRRC
jgi:hypothetical protein